MEFLLVGFCIILGTHTQLKNKSTFRLNICPKQRRILSSHDVVVSLTTCKSQKKKKNLNIFNFEIMHLAYQDISSFHSHWSRPLVTVPGWSCRVFYGYIRATAHVWSLAGESCVMIVQWHQALHWSMTTFIICNKTQ